MAARHIAPLALALLCSCNGAEAPAPDPTPQPAQDPKAELIGSLQGADVEGYLFSLTESPTQTTSSLTNRAVNELVTLEQGDTTLPLRYTRITEGEGGAATTYRSELVKKGDSLRIAVTDVTANRVVDDFTLPPPGGGCEPQFASLQACIADFNCTRKGEIQCEANRTCDPQFVGLTCCLTDGTAFSVHLVVNPDSIRCRFKDLVPDLEGFVLTQD